MSLRTRVEDSQHKESSTPVTRRQPSVCGAASFNRSRRATQDKIDDARREQTSPAGRRRRARELSAAQWEQYERGRKQRAIDEENQKRERENQRELARKELERQLNLTIKILGCTNSEATTAIRNLDERGIALAPLTFYDEVQRIRKGEGNADNT